MLCDFQCHKILHAKSSACRMHLMTIWSGNFQHLRNILAGNCKVKLLRSHIGVKTGRSIEVRQWNLRAFSTEIEGRNQKHQSSTLCNINLNLYDGNTGLSTHINTNKSQINEFKAIQCNNLQQKIPNSKVFDRPATILAFDIETTGLSRDNDSIIEIAFQDLIGGSNSTFQTLINPGKRVTNTRFHGISSHMVNRPDVPRFEELIPILLQYVRSRQMAGKPVLLFAHNARLFDVPFIIKEFHRCSRVVPDDWLFVDTLPLARQLVNSDGSKLANYKLEGICKHFQIPSVGQAHRAMNDVAMLSKALQRITFELKVTVPELIDRGFRASDLTKVPR